MLSGIEPSCLLKLVAIQRQDGLKYYAVRNISASRIRDSGVVNQFS